MPGNPSADDIDFDEDFNNELILIEQETEHKVSNTMSAIESAMEAWKAAGKKPPEARRKVVWLQSFYEELVKWEKKSLTKPKKEDLDQKLKRLNEFVDICSKYEESMPEAG